MEQMTLQETIDNLPWFVKTAVESAIDDNVRRAQRAEYMQDHEDDVKNLIALMGGQDWGTPTTPVVTDPQEDPEPAQDETPEAEAPETPDEETAPVEDESAG